MSKFIFTRSKTCTEPFKEYEYMVALNEFEKNSIIDRFKDAHPDWPLEGCFVEIVPAKIIITKHGFDQNT